MRPVTYSVIFLLLSCAFFSCKKEVKNTKNIVHVPTDSVYFHAIVDSMTFTASSATALFSGTPNPYIMITAKTGPDTTDRVISLRIDNFPNKTGEYIISPTTGGKASYSTNHKTIEAADSGRIVITSLGESVKGTFWFYTEKHMITNGTFSAQ